MLHHSSTARFGLILMRLFLLVMAVGLICIAFFGVRGYLLYNDALNAKSLDAMEQEIEHNRGYTKNDDLPLLYLQSVVAVEDHRFYTHPGFDIISTTRALINDLKEGALVEGGSTITQQLAKNEYFTQAQSVERKVAELFMSFTMEQHFSKQQILELYVNSIYFGNGYKGVGQASAGYYGKQAADLSPYEATMLAGIPNAPSKYAPNVNPLLAQQRQQQVLNKLVMYHYLSAAKGAEILNDAE